MKEKKKQQFFYLVSWLQGYASHPSWSAAILHWLCQSKEERQMRVAQTSDWETRIEGTLRFMLFPSISLATPTGNLVRKLFCVCLWTITSQVRRIQKETECRRRSYACNDDSSYNQFVERRRGDLLWIALKLLFTFKRVFKVPLSFIYSVISLKIIPHLPADSRSSLFSHNVGKWKGDHRSQSLWDFLMLSIIVRFIRLTFEVSRKSSYEGIHSGPSQPLS